MSNPQGDEVVIYEDFIACVEQHQTDKVKALYFESCCTTKAIPNPVLSGVPSLIQFLEKTEPALCQKGQCLYLFGLQPCAMVPHSDASEQQLYYVLKYLLLDDNKNRPADWSEEHNIVIDFSKGEVMDNQRYLSKVFDQKPEGISYGMLYHAVPCNTPVQALISEQGLNPVQTHYDC